MPHKLKPPSPAPYPPLREVRAEETERYGHHSGIQISDIKVRLMVNDRLRGWATIVLNDVLVIMDIRIIEGDQRLFVAMPSKKKKDGYFEDIVHPLDADFRDYLESCILDVYDQMEAEARRS